MKRFILVLVISLINVMAFSQDVNIRKEGKIFFTEKQVKQTEVISTGYTWKDSKGTEYPIYLTKTGKAYILRVSQKTGKEYKYYLNDSVSENILSENKDLASKITKKEEK